LKCEISCDDVSVAVLPSALNTTSMSAWLPDLTVTL
jgi:hypothetical protein